MILGFETLISKFSALKLWYFTILWIRVTRFQINKYIPGLGSRHPYFWRLFPPTCKNTFQGWAQKDGNIVLESRCRPHFEGLNALKARKLVAGKIALRLLPIGNATYLGETCLDERAARITESISMHFYYLFMVIQQ